MAVTKIVRELRTFLDRIGEEAHRRIRGLGKHAEQRLQLVLKRVALSLLQGFFFAAAFLLIIVAGILFFNRYLALELVLLLAGFVLLYVALLMKWAKR